MSWHGDIQFSDKQRLRGITLSPLGSEALQWMPRVPILRYLSLVATAQIPLHMIAGPKAVVSTPVQRTEQWLYDTLSIVPNKPPGVAQEPWWECIGPNSPRGILVGLEDSEDKASDRHWPQVTEILFFASSNHDAVISAIDDLSPRSRFMIFALPLSSDLCLHRASREPTPPASPARSESGSADAVFLPARWNDLPRDGEVVNRPPVRKRKAANDAFNEATERQRKARRKGGESVAAAAAPVVKWENSVPTLQHRRTTSNSQSVPLQTRPLSRSPSVTSMRPRSSREGSAPTTSRRSTLSRMQNVSAVPETTPTGIESKNKDTISKLVMTGMRLYGLCQSKNRKSKPTAAALPAAVTALDEIEADYRNDEEFKLVYHKVFKATCFAFRKHIGFVQLQNRTEALRETVDRLLAIFCGDPLAASQRVIDDDFTPGGRKIFGSAPRAGTDGSDFMHPFNVIGNDDVAITPCLHRSQ